MPYTGASPTSGRGGATSTTPQPGRLEGNIFRPEGKDYVVDLTHKTFPCVVKDGRKILSVAGEVFNLPEEFEVSSNLGSGSYCTVLCAKDTTTGKEVAVKKCTYVFARPQDGKRLLREVKLSRGFRHPNVLQLQDILVPLEDDFKDLYFITEKMDLDLYHYQKLKALQEPQCKSYTYQTLKALHYIHSAQVVHRDIKPDNILLRESDGMVKLCDFNLSRGFNPTAPQEGEDRPPLTDNIATIWYRAPEILLDNPHYTSAADIWSLGCVFAEMLSRKTLFEGKTQIEMLQLIIKALALPKTYDLSWISSHKMRTIVYGFILQSDHKEHLAELLPDDVPPAALAFLRRMLQLDPRKRATTGDLLRDPYLKGLYNPASCSTSSHVFKWKYDDLKLSERTLRQLFWKEIHQMHPEAAHRAPQQPQTTAATPTPNTSTTNPTPSPAPGPSPVPASIPSPAPPAGAATAHSHLQVPSQRSCGPSPTHSSPRTVITPSSSGSGVSPPPGLNCPLTSAVAAAAANSRAALTPSPANTSPRTVISPCSSNGAPTPPPPPPYIEQHAGGYSAPSAQGFHNLPPSRPVARPVPSPLRHPSACPQQGGAPGQYPPGMHSPHGPHGHGGHPGGHGAPFPYSPAGSGGPAPGGPPQGFKEAGKFGGKPHSSRPHGHGHEGGAPGNGQPGPYPYSGKGFSSPHGPPPHGPVHSPNGPRSHGPPGSAYPYSPYSPASAGSGFAPYKPGSSGGGAPRPN